MTTLHRKPDKPTISTAVQDNKKGKEAEKDEMRGLSATRFGLGRRKAWRKVGVGQRLRKKCV